MAKFYVVQPAADAEGDLTNAITYVSETLPQDICSLDPGEYRVAALDYATGSYTLEPPSATSLIDSLFGSGQKGAFYVTQPVVEGQQALYIDEGMTVPVTADGDPVGAVRDLSGNGNHAIEAVSASRLIYRSTPSRLVNSGGKQVNVPLSSGLIGDMTLATNEGTATYGVDIPSGSHELGGEYFPGGSINGALFRDGVMTTKEKAYVESYFVGWSGATES